jgi:hypothetical protein
MSTPATPQAWLEQVRADPEATEDIRKVAAAIAECAPPEIDLGLEKYLAIGGSHGVYADEFLFQLADDVTELRAVPIAIDWLGDRGYLDICVWQTSSRGSLLMCALATGGAS